MNLFQEIGKDVTAATSFLITVFTKGPAVAAALSKLSGPVMAGMLAVFHDVLTTVTAGAAVGAAVQAGNIPAAFTMSATTLALLGNLKTSVVAEDQLIVADLKTLGIIK